MYIPLFLIPIFVGLTAQLSKRFFNRRYLSKIAIQGIPLPRYGGMPSAHTAFAFSLATVVLVSEGVYSSLFAIAVAIIIFILDDALRMRMFLGRHGQAITRLIRSLPEEDRKRFPYLETRLGHTPAEVLAGALVGIFLTLVIMFFAPWQAF